MTDDRRRTDCTGCRCTRTRGPGPGTAVTFALTARLNVRLEGIEPSGTCVHGFVKRPQASLRQSRPLPVPAKALTHAVRLGGAGNVARPVAPFGVRVDEQRPAQTLSGKRRSPRVT